jgi:hypothetical protein
MSIRYRIIQRTVVADCLLESAALEMLMQIQDADPTKEHVIEEYQYVPPEGKGMGRDPELH